MKLRALIVDDEPPARRRLRTLLKDEPGISVAGECEDGASAVAAVRTLTPDVVFLDVQMPGMDGFDVIDAIGPARCPAIVFVTAYDKYALKAFEVHAVDYLLKPFDRARLRQALANVKPGRPLERLVVKSRGRVYFVRVEEIDWIEASGHYLTLHAGRDAHLIRGTMADLEARLDRRRFIRVRRSAIVNVDRIQELRPASHGECEVVLRSGVSVPSGRAYGPRVRALLRGSDQPA
jgi:two-component system LytT family response regulator